MTPSTDEQAAPRFRFARRIDEAGVEKRDGGADMSGD